VESDRLARLAAAQHPLVEAAHRVAEQAAQVDLAPVVRAGAPGRRRPACRPAAGSCCGSGARRDRRIRSARPRAPLP
jgi:hypothetical protein